MKEGDIVLASLTQADGKTKLRPALLLRQLPPYNDFLICGISSQLHQMTEDFDELISEKDIDFRSSGIIKESIIRLSFIAVAPVNLIAGKIGEISDAPHRKLLQRLSNYLIKDIADGKKN